MLEPVCGAAFLMHGNERRHVSAFREAGRQVSGLLESFEVALRQDDAAGTNGVQQFPGFTVRLGAMETKEEKLSDFLFQCEAARVFHFFTGCPLLLIGTLPEIGELSQRLHWREVVYVQRQQLLA